MQNTVAQYLSAISAVKDREAIRPVLNALADRLSSRSFSAGGLAIKTGGSALAKTVNTVIAMVSGVYVSVAAADMPALTGLNIGAGKFNAIEFRVDSAGAVTAAMGTEGATAAAVKFPAPVVGKVTIGFIMVTYASAFTGGTTPLDTATTVYVDCNGAFDPTALL